MSQNVNALATFTFYRLPRSRLPLIRSVSASASLNLIYTNLKSNTYRYYLNLAPTGKFPCVGKYQFGTKARLT